MDAVCLQNGMPVGASAGTDVLGTMIHLRPMRFGRGLGAPLDVPTTVKITPLRFITDSM